MLNRRHLLQSIGAVIVSAAAPRLTLARAPTDNKLVLVVLRGAVDGLALAAPYGDGNYHSLRGELALASPGAADGLLKLDGLFGLHPSLQNTYASFSAGEASIVHAVASPYRERSHFDGQDLLETGANKVGDARDGWLNRALAPLGGGIAGTPAIALAQNAPLVLRGDNPVTSWVPSQLPDADEATLRRLQDLYADDEFFASRLRQALRSQEIGDKAGSRRGARGNDAKQFADLMTAAARFLSEDDGPAIAVTELGGWDTHANQGAQTGTLARRFTALDNGLGNLQRGLGRHWSSTVVVVVTEFGRTVRVNGTRGTDHGTGTAAIVMGGAVNGGKVIADWPGLGTQDLFAARDLKPTTDLRSLFKTVLADHLQVPPDHLEKNVFPGSSAAKPMKNLINT